MNIRRKAIAGIAAAAIAMGLATAGWRASGESVPATAPSADDPSYGIGETLLLVVADVVSPAESTTTLATLNERFGDLQGFYADATDGYDVTGALLQTSPDLVVEQCTEVADDLVVPGQLVDAECSVHGAVKALQPITTSFVDITELGTLKTAALCAPSGDSCGLARVRQLLGDDTDFAPGSMLIASGFRTKRGAEEFLDLARAAGVSDLVTFQVRKLFGGDVGLGQEPAPDGSGPLTGPLPAQERYQR